MSDDASPSFTFKVVVAGPFGSGKTTLIRSISSTAVVGTEVAATGVEAAVKQTTTVGIEYGRYTVIEPDLSVELVLIGTPGQSRFDEIRAIAAIGMDGLVLLVDGSDPSSWPDAAVLLRSMPLPEAVPLVVGTTRCPRDGAAPAAVRAFLGLDPTVAVLASDPRDARSARQLLVALLAAVLDQRYDQPEEPW